MKWQKKNVSLFPHKSFIQQSFKMLKPFGTNDKRQEEWIIKMICEGTLKQLLLRRAKVEKSKPKIDATKLDVIIWTFFCFHKTVILKVVQQLNLLIPFKLLANNYRQELSWSWVAVAVINFLQTTSVHNWLNKIQRIFSAIIQLTLKIKLILTLSIL